MNREQRIINLARQGYQREGTLEIDDGAVISEGGENGAYVQAWVWVSFSGTELDREDPEHDHCAKCGDWREAHDTSDGSIGAGHAFVEQTT